MMRELCVLYALFVVYVLFVLCSLCSVYTLLFASFVWCARRVCYMLCVYFSYWRCCVRFAVRVIRMSRVLCVV